MVTRPTVARVTNNLVHTQAKSVNSELESIVFSPSESYSTIWPGKLSLALLTIENRHA